MTNLENALPEQAQMKSCDPKLVKRDPRPSLVK